MNRVIVLVAAAGGGTRFGTATPKQYALLDGQPVILRTLARLRAMSPDAIVVALAPDDRDYERIPERPADAQVLRCGGDTRARTVAQAVDALAADYDDADWIAVHDAARPCVPAEALARLADTLCDDDVGGLLAVPVADTLKHGDGSAEPRVVRTEDRRQLWQAQTPQMFRYGVLARAFREPGAAGVTDESGAVELLAARGACAMPRLVAGSRANLKVTWPEDFAIAAAILAAQAEGTGGT